MVPIGSYLEVVDNSGVQQIQIIGILKKFKKRYGTMRDFFVVVIKKVRKNSQMMKRKVKKGGIVYGLLVKTNIHVKRFGGTVLKGEENGIVVMTKDLEMIARRINSYVYFTFRERNMMRLLTIIFTLL